MMRTIIMSGGLGNQMFQYAFFLSMVKRGIICKIDDTLFYISKMHCGFELEKVFKIGYTSNSPSIFRKIWIRFLRKYKPSILLFTDKAYTYCQEVYQSNNPYLMGDWLSPQYFDNMRNELIHIFTFRNISKKNIDLAKKMQICESVSIHIRRGDYLNLPNYCVCTEEYYKKAIKQIQIEVLNPHFYIFSNEPLWCKQFMKQFCVNYEIIDWNQGEDSFQDMYLMTQCKHNIIANSTFSWWGAWLNVYSKKIVIAPNYWFNNNNNNINCPDWVLI